MKKNDDIKLDVTSNIDEKIIDEVTDKKISLLQKSGGTTKNLRKRFIAIGSIAASFILMFSVLLVIIIPMLGSDVPVYQGMTIRQNFSSYMEVQEYDFSANGITLLSASRDSGFVFLSSSNGNGNAYGHDKDNHKKDDDQPENDIEDIVVIDVKTDDEVRYYVKPGETFIIEIHIDNPRDYEIQSFTLNGQKYANYMFKEGSTMELLLLEVTAPSEPGYVEYTIDAIKYIDGTEIKDVDMSSGDKSVKAGIAYPTAPSASVTSQSILPTSIELSVNVTDPYSLIGENELSIYLSDGENIISSKPLSLGENNIIFDNLTMNKTYEYGVVTAYDLVDGKNLHKEWLLTSTVTTAAAFGISNATSTQTSISFEVNKIGEVGEITSISLFDAETNDHVASGGADIREFTGLLSNHTYNLYVDFKYTANGEEISDWVAIKGIKTAAKTEPTINFNNISVTDTTIVGNVSITDPDSIGEITSVALYKGDTLIQNNSEKKIVFSSLDSYTNYKAAVTYIFDLNDGTGVQTKTSEYNVITAPRLEFISCKIINTDDVKEGDKIYMQVELDNPSGALPSSVTVNGQSYNCTSSTTAKTIYVEIVNDGQFEGGDTVLTVERVNMTLDGKNYSVSPSQNNSDSVFIRVKLENLKVIGDFKLVVSENEQYVAKDYVFPSEKLYLILSLINESQYTVSSITVQEYCTQGEYNSYEAYGDPITVTNPTMLANGDYLIEVYPSTFGNIGYEIQIAYSSLDQVEAASSSASTQKVYRVASDEIKEVSTYTDLLNMNEKYYYQLTTDIDLDGINWIGSDFDGYFDGNGNSIKNMSRVGTLSITGTPEPIPCVGLFSRAVGIIKNLTMENAKLIIDCNGLAVNIGIICGSGAIIDNCHVDKDSLIITTDHHEGYPAGVGGLVGSGGYIINSSNSASINSSHPYTGGILGCSGTVENCVNNGSVSGTGYVGGIAGGGDIINCINNGAVSGTDCVGGIVGESVTVEGCINNGSVSGTNSVGGIVGVLIENVFDITVTFKRCANYGSVTGQHTVGGIIGYGGGAYAYVVNDILENCANYGSVTGIDSVGGIAGDYNPKNLVNCFNAGTVTDAHAEYYNTFAGGIVGRGGSNTILTNCVNVGTVMTHGWNQSIFGNVDKGINDKTDFYWRDNFVNCHALGDNATVEQLNSKDFYINTLGWSEDIWNLDDLDVANGKYPTLK